MNTVSILVTVIIINWNFRGPRTHRMPQMTRRSFLFLYILSCRRLVRRLRSYLKCGKSILISRRDYADFFARTGLKCFMHYYRTCFLIQTFGIFFNCPKLSDNAIQIDLVFTEYSDMTNEVYLQYSYIENEALKAFIFISRK